MLHTITLTVTDNEGATGTDQVVVTVNEAPVTLAVPSNLAATAVSNMQVNLSWQHKSSDEGGFVLEGVTRFNFTVKVEYFNISANTISYIDKIQNNKKRGNILL